MANYSYGVYANGPDPLAPPYDVHSAVDAIGEAVLAGATPAEALQDLLKKGLLGRQAQRAFDDLIQQIRDRQREIRSRGRLDGTLEQCRILVDTAVGQERDELSNDLSDEARRCEADLDALPADMAKTIGRMANYNWRSPAARQSFELLRLSLLSEVLDAKFRGLRQALQDPGPQVIRRIEEMLSDLNAVLAADVRGEHTRTDFTNFMQHYADLIFDRPQALEELTDSLCNRMAAAEFVLRSLPMLQRGELVGLIDSALDDAGLASEMARLTDALRASRPNLNRSDTIGNVRMSGDEPLGLSDATSALEELTHLTALESALARAGLDDGATSRLLDRYGLDIGRVGRELERQRYLKRENGHLELTPKAVRRLGDNSLRRILADMNRGSQPGDHDQPAAGQAGELAGVTRPWEFGDDQPLDISATLRNALVRARQIPISLEPRDFEVVQTERRTAAAISLLIDLSYSMPLRGAWEPAKQTALALHALLRSRFPQDVVQVIGFSNVARELREAELAGLGWDMVQGTNLHHALILAGRHIDRYPQYEPLVLIVTDGEPTAHLQADGRPWFDWPPGPETIKLTLAEVDKMTRRHVPLSIFLLADDDRLIEFTNTVAKRNGGRVLQVDKEHLGEYVIAEFLRIRNTKRI